VINHYGPTESTVGAVMHEVTTRSLEDAGRQGASTVPIGRPLPNTHAYVVDVHGEELPVGLPGELWLGGSGVSSGYLNRPELSAERYVSFRGERVYRTGDRVRRLADGSIEFLGRTDGQVKLRGQRVELGEIEQALRTHPAIEDAAVIVHSEHGEHELVAYAVAKRVAYGVSHDDPNASERLIQWLAAQLPSHMLPSRVLLLDSLPLLPSGKIDRAALRARSMLGR
jgi:acyl-coenzyme A synthetase/AMP-(fatty) acid ligase